MFYEYQSFNLEDPFCQLLFLVVLEYTIKSNHPVLLLLALLCRCWGSAPNGMARNGTVEHFDFCYKTFGLLLPLLGSMGERYGSVNLQGITSIDSREDTVSPIPPPMSPTSVPTEAAGIKQDTYIIHVTCLCFGSTP